MQRHLINHRIGPALHRPSRLRRLALCMLTLGAFLPLLAASPRVLADAASPTTHIYLYDSSGTPVDVTPSYYYQEGHIYDLSGHLIGVVPNYQEGHIYNLYSTDIGYITIVGS
jgi:hypothetical protein